MAFIEADIAIRAREASSIFALATGWRGARVIIATSAGGYDRRGKRRYGLAAACDELLPSLSRASAGECRRNYSLSTSVSAARSSTRCREATRPFAVSILSLFSLILPRYIFDTLSLRALMVTVICARKF